jgi:hypothetical protein
MVASSNIKFDQLHHLLTLNPEALFASIRDSNNKIDSLKHHSLILRAFLIDRNGGVYLRSSLVSFDVNFGFIISDNYSLNVLFPLVCNF